MKTLLNVLATLFVINYILFLVDIYDKYLNKVQEKANYSWVCSQDECLYHTIADALRNRAGVIKLKGGETYRECITVDYSSVKILGAIEKNEKPTIVYCPVKIAKKENRGFIVLKGTLDNLTFSGLTLRYNGLKDIPGFFIYQECLKNCITSNNPNLK
jgi:hypothetical protein